MSNTGIKCLYFSSDRRLNMDTCVYIDSDTVTLRQRNRQTDRQTERQTETGRYVDRYVDRQTETDRYVNRQICRQTSRYADRQTDM